MRRQLTLVCTLAAAVSLGACRKTGEGEYKVVTPDVNVSTDTSTLHTPSIDVGTTTDTIRTPVVGTTKDTIVVNRPVVGTQKTTVQVPTVDVNSARENARRP